MLKSTKIEFYEVFEENWVALNIYLKVMTQWTVSNGAYVGLNYQSLEFVFKVFKVKDLKETLEKIQVMELAALKILNKGNE